MDVTVRAVFDAPREQVVAVAGDPTQAPRWFSNVRSVRPHDEQELATGSRFDWVSRFLGRELVYTYTVLDLVPQERLVVRTEQGSFPVETTFVWWDEEPDPVADGERPRHGGRTGMSVRVAGRPTGMTTLGSSAVTLGMKRALRRDLERLRLVLREEPAGV